MPYFSIIIPTYNRVNFLVNTINSICCQTFEDWEVIIVDDGSTDNTRETLLPIIDSEERIKYFYKENEERCIARNYGAIEAKGQYFIFFDSDDLMLPDHLATMYNVTKNNNYPVLSSGIKIGDRNVHTKEQFDKFGGNVTEGLCGNLHVYIPSSIFRCDIVKQPFFYPDARFNRNEDLLCIIEVSLKYPIRFVDHLGVRVLDHIERSVYDKDYRAFSYGVEIIKERLKGKLPKNLYNILISQLSLMLANKALESRRYLYFSRNMVRSVKYNPRKIVAIDFWGTLLECIWHRRNN